MGATPPRNRRNGVLHLLAAPREYSMKKSGKILVIAAGLLALGLTLDYHRSGADPAWKGIKSGMTASEIHHLIGPPDTAHRMDKRVEIWWHRGLLRTTSLAVLYYNPDSPETASMVCCSTERAMDKVLEWIFCKFIM